MRLLRPLGLAASLGAGIIPATHAQQADTASKPGGATTTLPLPMPRSVKFTTDEGTWMSLDVSPDGKTVVFDLAGDLYTMPITGGKATRITDGPGYDAQPRFSRDGKHIVFQSDRSGSENLYTVDPDGKNVKAYTTGSGNEYLSPTFSPDGNFVVTSRAGYNGLGNYDLYLYRGANSQPLKLNAAPANPYGPYGGGGGGGGGISGTGLLGATFGAENRYLYYSVGTGWGYNMMSFPTTVQRYDFETGETKTLGQAGGGAFRPMVSLDGKWLVYATRRDTSTSFRVKNLETLDETWLIDNIQRDDEESRHTRDLLPGSAFTPDSKAIITSMGGKFWRVEVPSGKATLIPFEADVDIQLGERVRFEYPINDTTLTATQIQNPKLSPDNRRVTFTSLNQVWVADLPSGTPKKLTSGDPASTPIWSPDGQSIVYTTWNDSTGYVYKVPAAGGDAVRLTKDGARYGSLAFNPSGSRLLLTVSTKKDGSMLAWMPSNGGEFTKISNSGYGTPYFVKGDSTRIYMGMTSMRWDGYDVKTHLRSYATSFSPTGEWLLTRKGEEYAIARVPLTRDIQVDLVNQGSPLLARGLGGVVPEFGAWSNDGSKVVWSAGRFLFVYDIPKSETAVADSIAKAEAKANAKPDSAAKPDTAKPASPKPVYEADRYEMKVVVPKDRPVGTIVLQNVRIITMKGDEVIERGDVVITNNIITAVGLAGQVDVPAGATKMDLRGRTIMPGMVDVHAHPWGAGNQPWQYVAALAYGVTTSRDPQASGHQGIFNNQDLVEIGDILGPRIYSTGPGLFGGDFSTVEKAKEELKPYAEYWHTQYLKQYMTGDRKVRQHILMAAKELRIAPTLEGGLDFKKNITEAIDGYTGSEHAYPITPLYKDMVEIIAKSGITYTPTLLVAYGGPWSENYMYEQNWEMRYSTKLQRFVPQKDIDSRFMRRPQWFADNLYPHKRLAAQAAKIVRAGGHVGLGGHGQLTGLGDQFELWLLQSGGMTPLEAIRCATLFGAEELGMDKQIGSIEVGKFADFLVLDKNPLDDIRNTLTIKYVVKNGRIYDGETLDEEWPRRITRKPFPWMSEGYASSVVPDDDDLKPTK